MKKNWIIIIILFLLAANAALVSTLIFTNRNNAQENTEERRDNNRERNNNGKGRFERHLTENLDLSEGQIQQIKIFRTDFQQKKRELQIESRKLSHKYYKQFSASESDSSSLELVASELGDIHTQMMLLDFKHYRNIRSVCTAEQAHKLDSLGRSRFEQFKNKRDEPGMQWRQKHQGESRMNKNRQNVKNHENK